MKDRLPRLAALHRIVAGDKYLVGADIRVSMRLVSGAARVRMDPGQLEQLVVNLILNARDAMPSGGELTIETAERQISRTGRGRHVRPGRLETAAGLPDTETERPRLVPR